MRSRRKPYRHRVRSHTRKGKYVKSHLRGKGKPRQPSRYRHVDGYVHRRVPPKVKVTSEAFIKKRRRHWEDKEREWKKEGLTDWEIRQRIFDQEPLIQKHRKLYKEFEAEKKDINKAIELHGRLSKSNEVIGTTLGEIHPIGGVDGMTLEWYFRQPDLEKYFMEHFGRPFKSKTHMWDEKKRRWVEKK